jgi:hypothetical protein
MGCFKAILRDGVADQDKHGPKDGLACLEGGLDVVEVCCCMLRRNHNSDHKQQQQRHGSLAHGCSHLDDETRVSGSL